MSLFSWFTRKSKPQAQRMAAAAAGPLNGHGKPVPQPQAAPSQDQARRNERTERRELLYTAVRDAMVRAGVLSAGYKFKVLSLDQRGGQFLVMMDMAPEYGSDMQRLTQIEALIAQSAKARFDIVVPAIYWRTNPQIVVGTAVRLATAAAAQPRVPEFTAPAALATSMAPAVRPAAPPRPSAPVPVPAPRAAPLVPPAPHAPPAVRGAGQRFDPIEADEVAAFKQALVNAAGRAPAAPAEPGAPTRSGPLLPPIPATTGFEDTLMPGQESRSPDLSSTQYGDLR